MVRIKEQRGRTIMAPGSPCKIRGMGREETGDHSSWCYLVGPWHFGIKGRRGFR